MSDAVLQDQPARDRIRTAFDAALFVEAGAGTGKTTELVQRVVGLVESGRAKLGEIVAITFTEAAAGELRERVRSLLEARAASAQGEPSRNLVEAIGQVEDAPMQTIHGFANRLLQMYPTEVNLPPVFEVRDSTDAALAFDAEWRAVARRLFVAYDQASVPEDPAISVPSISELSISVSESERVKSERAAVSGSTTEVMSQQVQERLLHMAWALGADMRKLRALARGMHEHAHRLHDLEPFDEALEWLPLVESLVKKIDAIVDLRFHCQADEDSMFKMLRDEAAPWRDALVNALQANDEFACAQLLRSGLTKAKGSVKRWPEGVLEQIREACLEIEVERKKVLGVPQDWALKGLISLAGAVARQSEARRIREGMLEFGDLLVLADRLMQDERVRREVQLRYRYVFVDEFQDTDPLQARLMQNLITPVDGGEARLFTVGDPKQSIYRFRNADLDQYLAVRSTYAHAIAELTTNFRTLGSILSWVDSVFAPLLGESLERWASLGHGRAGDHTGTVQIFGSEAEPGMLSAHVREVEAEELARRLGDARAKGWLVHGEGNSLRPIRYGDMAVLLPTRRSLASLERAFRHAGIPYRVESRSLIWSTQEIRDVVALLRVIDDPHNEHALIAALRSPAFGCGDDELAQWRMSGHSWDVLDQVVTQDDGIVAEAILAIRGLRDRARFLDVPAIVDLVIYERGLFHGAFGHMRQREPWNRLRFLADQAQGWFDNGNSGLHSFLQWVDENEELQASLLESVVPEADDDAVRVMTIHAAKGLEFPLAAIVGLGSVPNVAESVRVLWRSADASSPEVRIGPQADGWQTSHFDDAADRDSLAESAERLRLLYVAVTRARDHLLVGIHRTAKERSPGSLASILAKAVIGVDAIEEPACAPAELLPFAPDASLDHAVDRLEDIADRRAAVVKAATRNAVFSATRIAQLVSDADGVLPTRVAGHVDDPEDLSYRLTLGSAVHQALESLAFDSSAAEVERVAALVAHQWGIQGREQSIVEAAGKAFCSSPVREAAAGRSWREVSVAKDVDGVVLRGTIDLLYERSGGGLVVVDYKTEAVTTAEEIDHAVERYRYQLLTYAAALEQEGVGRVEEVVLLFVPPGAGDATVVKLPAAGARDAVQQVLASGVIQRFG